MKYLGEKFKLKREEIGISVDEVSDDLKIDKLIIENLEDGNQKVFKDVLELKKTVMLYAKYLGLNEDEIMDDLNDYLFEKTSKISIEDIKEGLKNTKIEPKKVKSPYTIEMKGKNKKNMIVMISLFILLLLILFYFILRKVYF